MEEYCVARQARDLLPRSAPEICSRALLPSSALEEGCAVAAGCASCLPAETLPRHYPPRRGS